MLSRRRDAETRSLGPHKKIRSVQAARALAAFMVVICHAAYFVGEEPHLWHRPVIFLWLHGTDLGVQLFFVLSGMVIFSAHRRDIDRPSEFRAFLWKRFRRIYPLYWIFFLITVMWHHSIAGPDGSFQRNPWVITSGAVLIHLFSTETNMVVAWSLFDEVMFYLCFSTLLINRSVGTLVLAVWIGASFVFLFHPGAYWQVIFAPDHLLFALGMFVAWRLEKGSLSKPRIMFFAGLGIFLTCTVVLGHVTNGVAVRLLAGAGAAFGLLGAIDLERRHEWLIPNWIVFIGDGSYSIYLAHFMVVSGVARFGFRHGHQLPVPPLIWIVIIVFSGLMVGLLTHLLIERPLLQRLSKP
jgi:exopolysaccharide production protein ExoZ